MSSFKRQCSGSLGFLGLVSVLLTFTAVSARDSRQIPSQDITCQWTNDLPPLPEGRFLFASGLDPFKHYIYIFGGLNEKGDVARDDPVIGLNLASNPLSSSWSERHPDPPLASRFGAAGAFRAVSNDPGQRGLVLIGGGIELGKEATNTLQYLYDDGESSSRITLTKTVQVPKRMFAAAIWDPVRDAVVVSGGTVECSANRDSFFVCAPSEPVPGTQLLVFQGKTTGTWVEGPPGGPAAIYGHTMVYDPNTQSVLSFGGTKDGKLTSADLWRLKLETLNKSGSNFADLVWERITSPGASDMMFHGAALDTDLDRVFTGGGLTADPISPLGFNSAIWISSPPETTRLSVGITRLPGLTYFAGALSALYDPARLPDRRRVVFLGGVEEKAGKLIPMRDVRALHCTMDPPTRTPATIPTPTPTVEPTPIMTPMAKSNCPPNHPLKGVYFWTGEFDGDCLFATAPIEDFDRTQVGRFVPKSVYAFEPGEWEVRLYKQPHFGGAPYGVAGLVENLDKPPYGGGFWSAYIAPVVPGTVPTFVPPTRTEPPTDNPTETATPVPGTTLPATVLAPTVTQTTIPPASPTSIATSMPTRTSPSTPTETLVPTLTATPTLLPLPTGCPSGKEVVCFCQQAVFYPPCVHTVADVEEFDPPLDAGRVASVKWWPSDGWHVTLFLEPHHKPGDECEQLLSPQGQLGPDCRGRVRSATIRRMPTNYPPGFTPTASPTFDNTKTPSQTPTPTRTSSPTTTSTVSPSPTETPDLRRCPAQFNGVCFCTQAIYGPPCFVSDTSIPNFATILHPDGVRSVRIMPAGKWQVHLFPQTNYQPASRVLSSAKNMLVIDPPSFSARITQRYVAYVPFVRTSRAKTGCGDTIISDEEEPNDTMELALDHQALCEDHGLRGQLVNITLPFPVHTPDHADYVELNIKRGGKLLAALDGVPRGRTYLLRLQNAADLKPTVERSVMPDSQSNYGRGEIEVEVPPSARRFLAVADGDGQGDNEADYLLQWSFDHLIGETEPNDDMPMGQLQRTMGLKGPIVIGRLWGKDSRLGKDEADWYPLEKPKEPTTVKVTLQSKMPASMSYCGNIMFYLYDPVLGTWEQSCPALRDPTHREIVAWYTLEPKDYFLRVIYYRFPEKVQDSACTDQSVPGTDPNYYRIFVERAELKNAMKCSSASNNLASEILQKTSAPTNGNGTPAKSNRIGMN